MTARTPLAAFLVCGAMLTITVRADAHPGGLNSSGCHNDRKHGGYHCHRSSPAPSPAPRPVAPQKPKAPAPSKPAAKDAKPATALQETTCASTAQGVMSKLVGFKDAMCGCATRECAAAVHEAMATFMRACAGSSVKMTAGDQRAAEAVGAKMGTCMAEIEKKLKGPGIDRAMISKAIESVKSKLTACGDASRATGKVKLKVTIAPDGKPSSVLVEEAPDTILGDCVANAVRTIVLPATQAGGTFSYPFVF